MFSKLFKSSPFFWGSILRHFSILHLIQRLVALKYMNKTLQDRTFLGPGMGDTVN